MADNLLSIRNLKIEATVYPPGEKPQDIIIVDGVSLDLLPGRVLGLIGESGAGKSTIGLSAMGLRTWRRADHRWGSYAERPQYPERRYGGSARHTRRRSNLCRAISRSCFQPRQAADGPDHRSHSASRQILSIRGNETRSLSYSESWACQSPSPSEADTRIKCLAGNCNAR